MNVTLRLTLEVEYEPNGVPVAELKNMLFDIVSRAAGDGLLTGDTPAVVDNYTHEVEVVSEPPVLTPEQQREADYLASGASKCPWCKSPNIEGTGDVDYDADWYSNHVVCNACGKEWEDVYTLSGIIED